MMPTAGAVLGMTLLDYLAGEMGCVYLSDLCWGRRGARLRWVISRTPAEAFPLKDWRDALAYMGGEAVGADETCEQIKERLCRACEELPPGY